MKECLLENDNYIIYGGETYLYDSYLAEYQLFSPEDFEKKGDSFRIKKQEEDYSYTAHSYCEVEGVRYVAWKLFDHDCESSVLFDWSKRRLIAMQEISEVWTVYNTGRDGAVTQEKKIHYLDPSISGNIPSDKTYYVEELASGNYGVSFLEEGKSLNDTINMLKALYGRRLQIGSPDMTLAMMDEFLCELTIDSNDFWLHLDWGIVSIGSLKEQGNCYIREIVTAFNAERKKD